MLSRVDLEIPLNSYALDFIKQLTIVVTFRMLQLLLEQLYLVELATIVYLFLVMRVRFEAYLVSKFEVTYLLFCLWGKRSKDLFRRLSLFKHYSQAFEKVALHLLSQSITKLRMLSYLFIYNQDLD